MGPLVAGSGRSSRFRSFPFVCCRHCDDSGLGVIPERYRSRSLTTSRIYSCLFVFARNLLPLLLLYVTPPLIPLAYLLPPPDFLRPLSSPMLLSMTMRSCPQLYFISHRSSKCIIRIHVRYISRTLDPPWKLQHIALLITPFRLRSSWRWTIHAADKYRGYLV